MAHRLHIVEANHARPLHLDAGRCGGARGSATDVERAHGELGAGLTDGLGGDHADRLADIHPGTRARSRP